MSSSSSIFLWTCGRHHVNSRSEAITAWRIRLVGRSYIANASTHPMMALCGHKNCVCKRAGPGQGLRRGFSHELLHLEARSAHAEPHR
eukprot:261743-Heterocapsa_arctica.AAC.1